MIKVDKLSVTKVENSDNCSSNNTDESSLTTSKKGRPQRIKRVIKPSGKKGKKFLDNAQMLALIADVNAEEEKSVDKKLVRMNKVGDLNQKRQEKMEMRQQEKQEYLETVKNSLRRKKRKAAVSAPVEGGELTTAKKVSFAV